MAERQSTTHSTARKACAATRLAPSPTGALHLGNARTFLINWAMARQLGWRVVLRIEDLDTPRTKDGADLQAIDDLAWLGTDWDEGPSYQADDLSRYEAALTSLRKRGLTYPCACTRKEIERAQSAPHADEHELRYPGTCRPNDSKPGGRGSVRAVGRADCTDLSAARTEPRPPNLDDVLAPESDTPVAWRVVAPTSPIAFHDRFVGDQSIDVDAQVGDFVVGTKAGLPAYQLAVVVDDARQGITDIVRGDDLLRSTARQLWLYRLLGLGPPPRYWHLPLILGQDGRRLAKRHGDTRLAHYRQIGVAPQRMLGLMARWCGMTDERTIIDAAEFVARFDIDAVPRSPITFTDEDDAWLRDSS